MPTQKASCRLKKMGINSEYDLGSFDSMFLFIKCFPCYLDVWLAGDDPVMIRTVLFLSASGYAAVLFPPG